MRSPQHTSSAGIRLARLSAGVVLGVVTVVGLAGCTAASTPPATTASTSAPTRIAFPSLVSGGPVDVSCAAIATALPAWSIQPNLTPGPGTAAQAAAALKGVGCAFADAAGDHLTVGAARIAPGSIADLKSFLETNGAVATTFSGDAGYFDEVTGDAELIGGPYWVSAVSDSIQTSADAAPILSAIVQTLPAG